MFLPEWMNIPGQLDVIFWPFLRLLSLLMTAPLFNNKAFHKQIKIALAGIIAFLIAPGMSSVQIDVFSYEGVLTGIGQLLIGVAVGLAMQLIFVAVRHAGEIAGLQMGLSFATFYDPMGGQNMPVVARLLNVLATLVFLTFNGHLYLLELMVKSFDVLPVTDVFAVGHGGLYLVQLAGMIFDCGLVLSLPIIAILLCVNLTLGVLNRLTPQLSVFVIGFPLSLSTGMMALALIMYTFAPLFERHVFALFDNLQGLLRALGN